jgi:hypothetical protein
MFWCTAATASTTDELRERSSGSVVRSSRSWSSGSLARMYSSSPPASSSSSSLLSSSLSSSSEPAPESSLSV